MKDKILTIINTINPEWAWQFLVISAIKVLGYGLLAIVTAIEEKR